MLAPILSLAIAALAQDGPPVVVEGQRPAQEKKVCRTERQTGSRVIKQTCRTVAEQRQAEIEARNKIKLGTSSTQPTEVFKRPTGQ